ncbi:hypothetical protein [Ekhidna sp.]
MRIAFYSSLILATIILNGQIPVYEYVSFNKSLSVPESINSERSAVIFDIPDKNGEFKQLGDYKKMLSQVHKGFVTMGIDAVFYLNHQDLVASNSSFNSYVELFNRRKVKFLIFITKNNTGYALAMSAFNGNRKMIESNADVFYLEGTDLFSILLNMGKEIRRADYPLNNFLIPEKPNYLQGLSTVENTLLKNYPGQLRRSILAVERFALLDSTKTLDSKVLAKIKAYNKNIFKKNMELEKIMTAYPYEYVLIDPMSDDELKRNRYQFLLRSVHSSARSVRQMLDYDVLPSETGFVSIIPIMPDQTKVKTIPSDALVYKFYVRQNISKNVHVGEWDADVTWQSALKNMIGNLTQKLNIKN